MNIQYSKDTPKTVVDATRDRMLICMQVAVASAATSTALNHCALRRSYGGVKGTAVTSSFSQPHCITDSSEGFCGCVWKTGAFMSNGCRGYTSAKSPAHPLAPRGSGEIVSHHSCRVILKICGAERPTDCFGVNIAINVNVGKEYRTIGTADR